MIELINVSKYYPTDFGRHYVFQDVSLVLPVDKSVGVLGPNGAGKSTFLRLLGGSDMPSEGRIIRTGRISPAMGLTPGLQASLTASENARFAGRIYGLQRDEIADLIDYVRDLANIGKYFDMPTGTYSAGMRQRVAFAINMSMNFDYYLFDEISAGGDKDFRQTANAMVKERLKTSKFIIASHRSDELLDMCDCGIVIQNGNLTFYDNISDALAAYGGEDEKPQRRAKRAKRRAETSGVPAEAGVNGEPVAEGGTGEDSGRDITREERRQKRKLKKQQAVAADGVAAGPEQVAAESETIETDQDREALREQRRLQRLLKKQQAAPVDAQAVEAEPGITEAEAEPSGAGEGGDLEALREQRRLKRMLRKQQAAPVDAPAVEAEPAITEAEPSEAGDGEDLETLREQRRLKRLLRKQQAAPVDAPAVEAEPAITEAEPSEAGNSEDLEALREQRRLKRLLRKQQAALVEDPAAEAEPGIVEAEAPDGGEGEDRETLREQRRLKRLLRKQQEIPVAAEAPEPEPIVMEAESIKAGEDRDALREQRRAQRKLKKQQALHTEDAAAEPANVEASPETSATPEPTPYAPEPERGVSLSPNPSPAAAAIPRVGMAPLARRLQPRADVAPSAAAAPRAQQAAIAAASPDTPPSSRFIGSRSFLNDLASRRQGHAQATAARAARLLDQLLDDVAGGGRAASQTRAWLVAAAQETAAMEAAQAREMLDRLLSGEPLGKSPAAQPSRTVPVSLDDTSPPGRTRFGLRRTSSSLTNPIDELE